MVLRDSERLYYSTGGFFLEAKAYREHTCIAGGLFLCGYNKNLENTMFSRFLINGAEGNRTPVRSLFH